MAGCARVPRGRTVVDDVEIHGTHHVDEDDILEKIATEPTPTLLGIRLPWTQRSLLDQHVLERDVRRIARYYQARGYYDARVLSTEVVPDDDEVDIEIRVQEGRPVRIRKLRIEGLPDLPKKLRRLIRGRMQLHEHAPFDEGLYDASKEGILAALRNDGHARAAVKGRVVVAREPHQADVIVTLEPGPICHFRHVRIHGLKAISEDRVRVAMGIRRGDRFSDEALEKAQSTLFGLGVFESVAVRPVVDDEQPVVDVNVNLSESDFGRFRTGGGIAADRNRTTFHLTEAWEHRNLFGGLQRLTLGERPGLSVSPSVFAPDRWGFDNEVSVEFAWPGLPERETTFLHRGVYDAGLDTAADLCRHDVRLSTGFTRPLTKWLRGSISHEIQYDQPIAGQIVFQCPTLQGKPETYQKSFLSYLRESLVVDMRDDPFNTRRGGYASITISETPDWFGGNLGFVSVVGDVRGYLAPLKWLGLAGRGLVGRAYPFPSSEQLPAPLRFFGGGATGVRGYDTRTIGYYPDCPDSRKYYDPQCGNTGNSSGGGDVQWELSAEIRTMVYDPFGLVWFLDMGDVYLPNRGEHLDLRRHHASIGVGIRVKTPVGPVRFDVAGRLPSRHRADEIPHDQDFFGLFKAPVTLHFALGESF